MITPHKKPPNDELSEAAKKANKSINKIRQALVVGYVEECVDHPDSDYLHITQTRVAADTVLQIVCGAANIEAGQKVLVAQPGAVMPDG